MIISEERSYTEGRMPSDKRKSNRAELAYTTGWATSDRGLRKNNAAPPETVPAGARLPRGDGRLPEPVGGRAGRDPGPRLRARRTRRRPAEEAGRGREGPREPGRDQAPVHEELVDADVDAHGPGLREIGVGAATTSRFPPP